jgi:predicted RNase H-like HicB family nuclease
MISVTEHGYLIVIERGAGNFGAWAPDLPGCVAVGDTIEECEREMREAIAFHIEGLREDGEPVPEPTTVPRVVLEALADVEADRSKRPRSLVECLPDREPVFGGGVA